jgi:HAD superfamily hydrolase (TIGR01484 family)
VKLSVFALDYDGTIAHDDRLNPAVRDAIARARRRGIRVVLVTGRILDQLRRVAGDLDVVDCVVAENGGIVYFPGGGHMSTVAPLIPGAFIAALAHRGIPFQAGQCVIASCRSFWCSTGAA